MENIQYKITVQDDMTKVLMNLDRVANKIAADLGNVDNKMKLVGKTTNDMGMSFGKLTGAFAAGGVLAKGIIKLGIMLKDTIVDSFKAAMDNEQLVKSFEVLTGSAERGKNMAADLRQLKQTTIMGASVYKNAQTMLSFGIGQGEITKDLKQIGDIAMGDQQKMESLTLAFSQVRAGGKLMGQDLLQFINAGFNPLKVMSDRWQEFGFKSKKSVGELKELMSQGKITAEQVSKAFEVATSKGGQFYGMMDKNGEISAGKMKKLQGQWEAIKIDIGNFFLPSQLRDDAMDFASRMLHSINLGETATDTVRKERMEVNYLVSTITKLNKENSNRSFFLTQLNDKYPNMLKGLNIEKVSNEQLLEVLKKVNEEYAKKERYSIEDAKIEYLKAKRDAAGRTGREILSKLVKAEGEPDSWYAKIPKIFFGSDYWTKGKGSQTRANKFFEEQADYQKQIDAEQPQQKRNDVEKLKSRANELLELKGADAESQMGKNWKKRQAEIQSLIPQLEGEAQKFNIGGFITAYGARPINDKAVTKLQELINKIEGTGSIGTPTATDGTGSANVRGTQPTNFYITINDGLIKTLVMNPSGIDGTKEDLIKAVEDAMFAAVNNAQNMTTRTR